MDVMGFSAPRPQRGVEWNADRNGYGLVSGVVTGGGLVSGAVTGVVTDSESPSRRSVFDRLGLVGSRDECSLALWRMQCAFCHLIPQILKWLFVAIKNINFLRGCKGCKAVFVLHEKTNIRLSFRSQSTFWMIFFQNLTKLNFAVAFEKNPIESFSRDAPFSIDSAGQTTEMKAVLLSKISINLQAHHPTDWVFICDTCRLCLWYVTCLDNQQTLISFALLHAFTHITLPFTYKRNRELDLIFIFMNYFRYRDSPVSSPYDVINRCYANDTKLDSYG